MTGTFLTWMQEKTAPVFVVATANNISSLPAELLRKGRFDEIFFIDLPATVERKEIFRIHIEKRSRKSADFDLDKLAAETNGFSGSEIEQSVVSALYDAFDSNTDLSNQALFREIRNTTPISKTMKEDVERIRNWAESRTRNASGNVRMKERISS